MRVSGIVADVKRRAAEEVGDRERRVSVDERNRGRLFDSVLANQFTVPVGSGAPAFAELTVTT